MNPLADIVSKRNAGRVRVSLTSYYDEPLPDLLRRFGLGRDESQNPLLREIHQSEARTLLVYLLTKDMAYGADIMPIDEAESLVDHVLKIFSARQTRFLTNFGRPENPDRPLSVASSPMTRSTFDGGVVCLAKPIAGCIWVEDED